MFLKYKVQKDFSKFVNYLTRNVNLDMIEYASDKDTTKIVSTKGWIEELDKHIDEMISLFSYRTWQMILSLNNNYSKISLDKIEDIKLNLRKFLSIHYKALYKKFDMKTYAKYQMQSKENIFKILFLDKIIVRNKMGTAVIFMYKNSQRMAYSPKDKERIIIENIKTRDDSVIITFVTKKDTFWNKLKSFIFEED